MTFRVGQKVCCINDGDQNLYPGDAPVRLRSIYTVREVFDWFGLEGLHLQEILNASNRGYASERFRPVVSRETSIECFTRMLNPSKQGIDA